MWSVWGSMAITSNLQQNTVNQDLVSTPVCFVTGRSLILVTLYYFPGVPSLQLTQGGLECHLGLMFCWLLVLKWQVIGWPLNPQAPVAHVLLRKMAMLTLISQLGTITFPSGQGNPLPQPHGPGVFHLPPWHDRSPFMYKGPVGLRTVTRKPNLVGGFSPPIPPEKSWSK